MHAPRCLALRAAILLGADVTHAAGALPCPRERMPWNTHALRVLSACWPSALCSVVIMRAAAAEAAPDLQQGMHAAPLPCRMAVHMDCLHWVNRDSYLPQGSRGLKVRFAMCFRVSGLLDVKEGSRCLLTGVGSALPPAPHNAPALPRKQCSWETEHWAFPAAPWAPLRFPPGPIPNPRSQMATKYQLVTNCPLPDSLSPRSPRCPTPTPGRWSPSTSWATTPWRWTPRTW